MHKITLEQGKVSKNYLPRDWMRHFLSFSFISTTLVLLVCTKEAPHVDECACALAYFWVLFSVFFLEDGFKANHSWVAYNGAMSFLIFTTRAIIFLMVPIKVNGEVSLNRKPL